MDPQGISFDAPLKQATTVPVPAGVTFDSPLTQGTSVPATDTPSVPSAKPVNQPAQPTATMGATPGSMPGDPFATKVSLWAQNVQNDLLHGTDITGVGRVLKAMGAHGLEAGVSPETAKFMGSLPLGLLRATQGGAEAAQPGQRVRGAKNVAGGLLDAATIPSAFVAPEGAEALSGGMDLALEQASKAVKSIKAPFSVKAIQPTIQGAITDAIRQAASEHGIALPDTVSVRDITQSLSDAVRSKASGIYKQLDAALGGTRFQAWDEQLSNINRAIRDSLGIDPEKDAALQKRLEDVGAARNAAMDKIRAQGMDPDNLIGKADRLHRQAMALGDVSKALRASADAHPSQAIETGNTLSNRLDEAITGQAATKQVPANVRIAPLWKRMQALATPNPKYPGTPSRLVQALGEERAGELLNAVDAAHLYAQKIAARNQWFKRGAVGLGIAGAGKAAFDTAHDLLSSGQ
jgi:hypothetical protein